MEQNKRPTITMPPNLQTVSLKFARRRSAKVMGKLAEKKSEPQESEEVQGVLVTHNFTSKIVKPEDIATYTPLRMGAIASKLHVPFSGPVETLRLFITEMFAKVVEEETEVDGKACTKFNLQNMVRRPKWWLKLSFGVCFCLRHIVSHAVCLYFSGVYFGGENRWSGHCGMGGESYG